MCTGRELTCVQTQPLLIMSECNIRTRIVISTMDTGASFTRLCMTSPAQIIDAQEVMIWRGHDLCINDLCINDPRLHRSLMHEFLNAHTRVTLQVR